MAMSRRRRRRDSASDRDGDRDGDVAPLFLSLRNLALASPSRFEGRSHDLNDGVLRRRLRVETSGAPLTIHDDSDVRW
ncbi:hypothetical protein TIFTF001_042432 [Ficus carica]|uniref:Uncharacterized protein n=1 Tax=Ficus carica TaxID=3494 RepID=A0AA88A354_FICCA|nr:hypothetical protein TIFTF001_042427 [Ficus carica]GMN36405.1 hypothetical protein TIFTF001_042432 [Ficus carica]